LIASGAAHEVDISADLLAFSVNKIHITNGTAADGSASAPILSFLNDPNTGIYRPAADQIGVATGGASRLQISTTSATVYLPLTIQASSGQQEILRLNGGGTGSTNAAYMSFYDNAGTTRYGYIGDTSTGNSDITLRAEQGALNLGDSGNAGAIVISSGHTKIAGNIGFNNTTPIAEPTVTGSRGGNAALASLLTALANYGLITNSTTA